MHDYEWNQKQYIRNKELIWFEHVSGELREIAENHLFFTGRNFLLASCDINTQNEVT